MQIRLPNNLRNKQIRLPRFSELWQLLFIPKNFKETDVSEVANRFMLARCRAVTFVSTTVGKYYYNSSKL